MTDLKSAALAFAERNSLLYTGIIDGVKNFGYEILYADTYGVMCRVVCSGIIVLASESVDATKKILDTLDSAPEMVFCIDEHSYEYVMARFGFTGKTVCKQGTFLKNEPVVYDFEYEIKQLDKSHIDFVCAHYSLTPPEETAERIMLGQMIGAFSKSGEMMGFIGTHSEGTVGMLLVLPEYRRMGIAYALEAEMTNRVLREGRIPYCHIIVGNEASMALQRKLGYTFADETVYWLY